MARKLLEKSLILGTHNQGKIAEILDLLKPFPLEIIPAGQLGLKEPVEDGQTYFDNALIKARYCSELSGLPALADDSGIEVEALGNLPGVQTAPFTKEMGGIAKVFHVWQHDPNIKKNPRAHFMCVEVIAWPDGHYESSQARVSGRLQFPPCGKEGHGYDPVFIPDGFSMTVAEMSMAQKNKCSHRYLALSRLVEKCFLS